MNGRVRAVAIDVDFPGGTAPLKTIHFPIAHLLAAACACALAACAGPHGSDSGGARVLGSPGRQPGQYAKPRAIACTKDGLVYVVDRSGRIQLVDPATNDVVAKWTLPDWSNGTPTGISIDPVDGESLWVADTHYQKILHYGRDGTLLSTWGEDGTDPGQMIFPTDVCPSPDGKTVWVTEFGLRSRIMHFTRDGKFLGEWGSGEYEYSDVQRPQAVAAAPDGRLFVADAGNHRVLVFAADGSPAGSWGTAGEAPGELKYPYDIALAADGTVYVCEYGNSRVSHFADDGTFLGFWGEPGHDPGQLFSPWGVAVAPGGAIVVADTNNGRLQVVDDPASAFVREGGA